MTNSVNWLGLVVNWLPMNLMIGVWAYFMRHLRQKGRVTQFDYMEQSLREQQQQNKSLLAFLERMDQRLTALEQTQPERTGAKP